MLLQSDMKDATLTWNIFSIKDSDIESSYFKTVILHTDNQIKSCSVYRSQCKMLVRKVTNSNVEASATELH